MTSLSMSRTHRRRRAPVGAVPVAVPMAACPDNASAQGSRASEDAGEAPQTVYFAGGLEDSDQKRIRSMLELLH
eukprot:m.343854 g.343854  ORF g.343854 m.343854 type:complete len:74 (+) comp16550_c0_seq90:1730-1951(+)